MMDIITFNLYLQQQAETSLYFDLEKVISLYIKSQHNNDLYIDTEKVIGVDL